MIKIRRTDIDTLRAISVISVIIFHLDKILFPNGFLGVDLFFVISGYVITNSISKSLKSKSFSFLNFYLKRARRILPALLLVLLTSLIIATVILLTADLKRFSESLLSSIGFVSNFYFWLTGGYFSTNDQLKPLLHLWSLAVEEQFYLFFPIFLFIIFKIFKKFKYYLLGIIIVSILSFYLNTYFLANSDTVFFLFPFRIWQFGIGAALALCPSLVIKNIWLDSLYIFFALFLIFINFLFILDFLPDATLMCFGLGLILYKKINQKNPIYKIFEIKPLIFVGLISYSLYLWHWPIISFLKYAYIDGIPFLISVTAVATILFLSIFSWKYVEQPFIKRYSNTVSIKFIFINIFSLLILSVFIISNKNLPSRYDNFPNLLAESIKSSYDCPPFKYRKFESTYGCYVNNKNNKSPQNILFGNSHAFMYGWPFIKYLKDINESGIILQFSCLPYINVNSSQRCLLRAKTRFNSIISSKDTKNVFIGLTWSSKNFVDENGKKYIDKNFELRKQSINYLISELEKHKKKVILIGPIMTPNYDFASEYSRQVIFKGNKFKIKNSFKKFDDEYKDIINYYEKKLGKNFLQPHKLLCNNKDCFFADENGALFSDGSHLSKRGSMKILPLFFSTK